MRMRNEAATYSAFTFARSAGTVVLRIVLVIGLRLGVTGMYLADLAADARAAGRCCGDGSGRSSARCSRRDELRQALRFGLPRLPHGLAQQALDAATKLLLGQYVRADAARRLPERLDARHGRPVLHDRRSRPRGRRSTTRRRASLTRSDVFGKMTTYGVAVLVLLVAGTTAVARDVILRDAEARVPGGRCRSCRLIAVGIALQGVYLLTSIGLNLTSRTEFYPVVDDHGGRRRIRGRALR